ncbi:MAG: STAS domain-containing protein [Methyloceanibacter sp.]
MGDGRFVITRLNHTMVATLEGSIDADALGVLVDSLSEAQAGQQADSAIFEVSACEVMDVDEFAELQKAFRTIEWLGMRTVVAGLRPGIVSYIVSSGVDLGALRTALDLERALEELSADHDEQEPEPEPEPHDEPELEPDGLRPV